MGGKNQKMLMNVPAAMYLSRLPLKSQFVGFQVSVCASSSFFMHFYTIVMHREVKVTCAFVMLPRKRCCAYVTAFLLENQLFSCCHETQEKTVMICRSGPFISNVMHPG